MKNAIALTAICVLFLTLIPMKAADTIPASLSDEGFWRMVTSFSEEGGTFRYENLLSNEASYQNVIPALKILLPPGGVYLGVGPEQNFTYIAALEPKIAFIVDIRRQNMLEHLMYKALFELSADRAAFISQLFSRRRLDSPDEHSSADALFTAYEMQPADRSLLNETAGRVMDRLMDDHGFPLTASDGATIRHVLEEFFTGGPKIDYGFASAPSGIAAPTYSQLMTAADEAGRTWSYLSTEENFTRVRGMQINNMIVPLVGDFAGNKTLRTVAAYLKQRSAMVTAFYVSNVEQYLRKDESQSFRTNVSLLPFSTSSTLIRFIPPATTQLESISDFRFKRGSLFHLLNSEELTGVQRQ